MKSNQFRTFIRSVDRTTIGFVEYIEKVEFVNNALAAWLLIVIAVLRLREFRMASVPCKMQTKWNQI